ncbi:NAD(P) transhydrogenase alpha subunit [Mucilaginibacter gracilis]|uniref:proton-translocating NAD(P)(+) transhydrogenase n=1 Tax=Mucilaginibacter gracilis TaxID=423350 RepID=A0A495IWF4_9SPHI|nr:NAD(P) transhydrogenase subunit alpha [Mucilaginibacter gracilis]RKR80338.1 NAD(P) transhydrogenase alpha subunit [Mucilaginibacter gracilis]
MITIGILREPSLEARVSMLSAEVAALVKSGCIVWVESGAGLKSFCSDTEYASSGAIIKSRSEVLATAHIILSINGNDIPALLKGKVLIGIYQPLANVQLIEAWKQQNLTVFSLDMLPRITRAQSMDVLSSQANIAGYKAVLLAASIFPHYLPMMMTAAGSVPPAKVMIIGAGVAGLQAIATARRLGAVVEVFDTRPEVKEEVMSLGGRFIEVEGAADASKAGGYAVEQNAEFQQRQKASIAEHIKKTDILITTALIRGKKAPVLVTREMVAAMKPGSVIIDLASATGGNTEVTVDNATIQCGTVTVIGNSNLAATLPADASKLYGKNVASFLGLLINEKGVLDVNSQDEIIRAACVSSVSKTNSPSTLSPISS